MREIQNADSLISRSNTLSLGTCLSARRLSPREKQDCADSSRQQHYSRASLGNVISLIVIIAALIVAALSILADTRQDGKNQSGGY
jgi:hypothetical protein